MTTRRLSERRSHLVKVAREIHKTLPADSEEQAIELENQEALQVIGQTEAAEIQQIEAALERISGDTMVRASSPEGLSTQDA